MGSCPFYENDVEPNRFGWVNSGDVANFLFCSITDFCLGVEVIGKVVSVSESLTSQWDTKMAQDNLDDKLPFSHILQSGGLGDIVDSDIIKAFKGRTHYTKSQTQLVWVGTAPVNISLELEFMAINDTALEVEIPIQMLKKMVVPELKENLIGTYKDAISDTISAISNGTKPDENTLDSIMGYVPNFVSVSIFEHVYDIETNYILTDVSYSDGDMLRYKNGDRTRQVVSLTFQTEKSVNKTDIIGLSYSMQNEDNGDF